MIDKIETKKIGAANRTAIVKVDKFVNDGFAIAYEEGDEKVIFVRYAIPNEEIKVKIYRETSSYSIADTIEVLKPSEKRIKPKCEYFGLCGGCDYQMLDYNDQIEVKKELLIETFLKIAKIDISSILDILKSPKPFNYRNTETFKVNPRKHLIGFFRKDTKSVVDITHCDIAEQGINEALKSMRDFEEFPKHNFKVRTTNNKETSVHWVKSLYEDKSLIEKIKACGCEFSFKISKDSFFQINNEVIPLWLEKITSFINIDKSERIYDLYSGIGLITLFIGHFANETIGIEISNGSVKDANYNLKINNITDNIKFIEGDVAKKLNELEKADIVIIDPPRKGLDENSIDMLLNYAPKKIIYSSCKTTTLARDIELFSNKYKLEKIVLVDMFPQTHHIECVALLKLKIN